MERAAAGKTGLNGYVVTQSARCSPAQKDRDALGNEQKFPTISFAPSPHDGTAGFPYDPAPISCPRYAGLSAIKNGGAIHRRGLHR